MSLLGMLWRFGTRLRRRRVRNTSGGNDSNTSETESTIDRPDFDLVFLDDAEQQTLLPDSDIEFIDQLEPPKPALEVTDVPFSAEVKFSDDEPGGWLVADETIVRELEEL